MAAHILTCCGLPGAGDPAESFVHVIAHSVLHDWRVYVVSIGFELAQLFLGCFMLCEQLEIEINQLVDRQIVKLSRIRRRSDQRLQTSVTQLDDP